MKIVDSPSEQAQAGHCTPPALDQQWQALASHLGAKMGVLSSTFQDAWCKTSGKEIPKLFNSPFEHQAKYCVYIYIYISLTLGKNGP